MKKSSDHLGVKIVGGLKETSTPWAGASLLVDLFRQLGMDTAAEKVLPAKKSGKGLRHGRMVESFVLLSALGGECIDDMKRLRDDEGLAGMLSYRPPAPETARQWLDGFHDEALMVVRPLQGSFIGRAAGYPVACCGKESSPLSPKCTGAGIRGGADGIRWHGTQEEQPCRL